MLKIVVSSVVGLLLLSGEAVAQSCSSLPYTLTNGTTASATQVMANFNCVFDSPAFAGPVGIGMTPVNVLDITQNQNSSSTISLLNNNTGSGAYAQVGLTNGTNKTYLQQLGQGFGSTGVQQAGYGGLFAESGLFLGGGGGIYFSNNWSLSTEIARFDTSGNLDVGTTTSVNSSRIMAAFAGASAQGIGINDISSHSGSALVEFFASGSGIGSITNNGNTAVSFNTTSDERLKDDRGVLNAVPELMRLRVHRFAWKSTAKPDVGLFAQEAYKVLPDIVTKGGADPHKNPWQVNYTGLIPRLLVGWQNHEKRIEQLERNDNSQPTAQITRSDNQAQLLKLILQLEDRDATEAEQIRHLQTQMDFLQRSLRTRTAENHGQIPPILLHNPGGASGPSPALEAENSSFR